MAFQGGSDNLNPISSLPVFQAQYHKVRVGEDVPYTMERYIVKTF